MDPLIKQEDISENKSSPRNYLDGKLVVAMWEELRRRLPDAEVRIIQGIYSAQDWARNHLGWR
jgi:hypothetical protein